jgi:CBS-domain-containing membrane protein
MTRVVITVGAERAAHQAAQLMLDHSIGALPVTQGGRLVGIVTETGVLRAFVWLAGGSGISSATSHSVSAEPQPRRLP